MRNIHLEDDDDEIENPVKELVQGFSENQFHKKFLEQRKIFLWGVVDNDSAKHIVNRLLFLEAEKPGEEIKLYISSPGGMVTSGMVILDIMNLISSPVSTICMGMSASMGAVLLSAGEKGRRFIFPHGEVMIHQPSVGYIQGTAADLEIHAKQIQKTREISAKILGKNCGHTPEKILKDFDRDFWMDANESIKYGIVDKVVDTF